MTNKALHTLDLSRRSVLRAAALGPGAAMLLAAGLGSRAQAASKLTQAAANYQPIPKGNQRCNNCSQWLQPTDCKVVNGPVSATGWCSVYAAKW
jgi:High potential iron-sulfur protein